MNTTMMINITPEELSQLIRTAVREAIEKQPPNTQNNPLLTRQDVAEIFGISLVTLREWDRRGVIASTKVGGKRVYRQVDVDSAINNGISKWRKSHSQ